MDDIEQYIISEEKLIKYRNEFESYIQQTTYNGETIYNLLHKIIDIRDNKLYSPIECISLNIKDFENYQISHNESVYKDKIYFDEEKNILLSDYRPGNLFWDTQLGNMQQQNFTVDEFWADIDRRIQFRK